MSAMSKILCTNLKKTPCADIFHPGMTCFQSLGHHLIHDIPSSMRFAATVSLVPFLMKLKRCDKALIKETFSFFVEFSFFLYLLGNTISSTICLFRNIQGRHVKFTLAYLPAFIAGLWGICISDRLYRFCTISTIQVILEAAFKNKIDPITRIISGSLSRQTILYMVCSAIILHVSEKYKYKMFWFVTPPGLSSDGPRTSNGNGLKCKHEDLCKHYILKGIKHYFILAFALENIKVVVKKLGNVKSFSTYLKSLDWNAMLFLVSYVGVYRSTYCLMNNFTQLDTEIVHPLSAFFGGVSYLFYPKPVFMAYAVSMVGEIAWETMKKQRDTYPNVLQKIINLPYRKLTFSLALGLVVNNFVFHNWMLHPIAKQFINAATHNKADECLKNAAEIVWKFENSKLSSV